MTGCRRLDVKALRRSGALEPGTTGMISWSAGDGGLNSPFSRPTGSAYASHITSIGPAQAISPKNFWHP